MIRPPCETRAEVVAGNANKTGTTDSGATDDVVTCADEVLVTVDVGGGTEMSGGMEDLSTGGVRRSLRLGSWAAHSRDGSR